MEERKEILDAEIFPFKASGEHPIQMFFGIITVLILEVMFVMFAVVSEKLVGTVVAIALALLGLLLCRRFIRWVHFDNERIIVKYFYGNELEISYKDLSKFYKNKEGFTPFYVFVLKFNSNSSDKLKKITFHKANLNFEAFKSRLIELKNK